MVVLSATAYFWFIALGLVIGSVFGWIIKDEGISLSANIIWAVASAILTGTAGIVLQLGDGLLFATAGTLAVLYLANVFHLHHAEDKMGHTDQGIYIKSRSK